MLTVLNNLSPKVQICIVHRQGRVYSHPYFSVTCNYYELCPSLEGFHCGYIYPARMLQLNSSDLVVRTSSWKCQKRGQRKRKLQEVLKEGFVLRGTTEEACASGGACLVLGVLPVPRGSWLERSCNRGVLCCGMPNGSSAPSASSCWFCRDSCCVC